MDHKELATKEAQRRADYSGKPYRVYYAYGAYHVAPEDAMYYGGTVAVVHPQGEVIKQVRA